ncbi:glutathione S-transferase family protein [Thalassobaculum sp. OXR-137]|uniref:glutathione S-transferase family protein n=1 Tax=Thalassobaculum sp. OXR-137 TaxID=3100173 RepID=UPI002AC91B0C|nr:glutathione S-transferase family protein [Thalassobaculum sp. OXR-137]WPZ36522.1 glutathione S-transferase family protein [Thalassobaculum sp. OXR-137]
MKLYSHPMAPNALRTLVFLAEKGIEVPIEPVDIMVAETRTPAFLKKNSLGEIPVLELDDGTLITESVAICRYFEELQPEPSLMGATPVEAAQVEMWSRRMEQQILGPIAQYGLHTEKFFVDKVEQVPAYAETQVRLMPKRWAWLDAELSDGRTYVCNDRFSIADITGMATLHLCDFFKHPVPEDLPNVKRWEAALRARPSWKR